MSFGAFLILIATVCVAFHQPAASGFLIAAGLWMHSAGF